VFLEFCNCAFYSYIQKHWLWSFFSQTTLKRKFIRTNVFIISLRIPNISSKHILIVLSNLQFQWEMFWLALQLLWTLASFQFPDLFTIGRTPWTSNQPVARPLCKHRTAQTQNKHIYTPNIYALSGILAHDNRVRTSENSSCLRPLGYRDRLN
jgi:hypothetical protein